MYLIFRSKSVLIVILLILSFSELSCSPKPYIILDLFKDSRLISDAIKGCVAVVATDRIEYIVCEAEQNRFHIKIIPSSNRIATMVVTLEDMSQSSPLMDIIDRNINQMNISISYEIYPQITSEMAKKDKAFRFIFRSLETEKYKTEGLIIVNRYIIKNISGRDKLR